MYSYLQRTEYTKSLLEVRERAHRFQTSNPVSEIVMLKGSAVFATLPDNAAFSEGVLSGLMKEHGFGKVFFYHARHIDLGSQSRVTIMAADSSIALSGALEVWVKCFPQSLLMRFDQGDIPLPRAKEGYKQLLDFGSVFDVALGPYRVDGDKMRHARDIFMRDDSLEFFTLPTLSPIYREVGIPGCLLLNAPFNVPYEERHRMFNIKTTVPFPVKEGDKHLTIEDYDNPVVEKFFRARGDLDRSYIRISTAPPRLPDMPEEERDKLQKINSPADRRQYLVGLYHFGYMRHETLKSDRTEPQERPREFTNGATQAFKRQRKQEKRRQYKIRRDERLRSGSNEQTVQMGSGSGTSNVQVGTSKSGPSASREPNTAPLAISGDVQMDK